jgi:hypothetical protein
MGIKMSFVLEQIAQKLDQCCQQNSFHDLLDSDLI